MTLDPGGAFDFPVWLERHDEVSKDPSSRAGDGSLYPQRGVFGKYVSDFVAPSLRDGTVRHERSRVSQVTRGVSSWHVETESGTLFETDLLVIATSHPAPAPPREFAARLEGQPRFIADTTVPRALDVIGRRDRVLVVGTRLTAADVVATLDARGHLGPITLYSRRGLRSRGHARTAQQPYGDFDADPSRTALELLRKVRASVRGAAVEGLSWHAVLDALRRDAGAVWRRLPIREKRRLVKHLRPFWDVHRFRIAPQVEDVIEGRLATGSLRLLAAKAIEVEVENGQIWVTLQRRHGSGNHRAAYDAVVVTTGPAHGGILASQPWLADMARQGFVELDDTGLGLACDDQSRATTKDGGVTPGVFVSGPLARGTFGELMGLPQVSDHATLVARNLAEAIAALSVG
jgi:uncharacterized NAD(P)/FAD-binding protein YdhS